MLLLVQNAGYKHKKHLAALHPYREHPSYELSQQYYLKHHGSNGGRCTYEDCILRHHWRSILSRRRGARSSSARGPSASGARLGWPSSKAVGSSSDRYRYKEFLECKCGRLGILDSNLACSCSQFTCDTSGLVFVSVKFARSCNDRTNRMLVA